MKGDATRQDLEARLATEIEGLGLRLDAGPPLTDAELRRAIDAIADTFLALDRDPDTQPAGGPIVAGSPPG